MNNVKKFTQLEVKKYFRQPMTVGFGVIFPLIWIIINGSLYGNTSSLMLDGFGTIDFMFPAYVFMIILVTGLSSLPLVLAKNYESKTIMRYSFTPLKKYQYLLSIYLGGFITVFIATTTMFLLSYTVFDLQVSSVVNIVFFFIVSFFIFCGIASIGIIIASLVNGFQATLSISLMIYFILLFLSGATVPLPLFPESFQFFIKTYIPFSRMVMLLQNIWLANTSNIQTNLLITSIFLLLSFILAIKLFKWKN